MTTRSYPIEVQSDFLERITRARPIQALSEFIWNSLDADASRVEIFVEDNELGATGRITIRDNGTGIDYRRAPHLFGHLGGSWKRPGGTTTEGRFLHGQEGRGRFKAFALGDTAEWTVVYLRNGDQPMRFTMTMSGGSLREVVISDEVPASLEENPGVSVTISDIKRNFRSLEPDESRQELAETFALYLSAYKHVGIWIGGERLDTSGLISAQTSFALTDIDDGEEKYPATLDIVEWRTTPSRSLYLCNDKGFPLSRIERRFQVGPFQFSAYLKSSLIASLQQQGTLDLAEMNPAIAAALTEAQDKLAEHFRERAAAQARSVVEQWKDARVYPFEGDAKTKIEEVERQVFDIVAVNVAQFMPEFAATPTKSKALHLRLLRQAIEKSPEELQLILGEVLKLPKRKQEELAELLKDVSLSAIISAAKVVADRLRFLTGLEAILFDTEKKARLKERSQLHRILAQNCWLFGEEYNLSVDDRSLTEVLRKHHELLGTGVVIDEPVRHVSKTRGIVDLVLSRTIRRHRADELVHLVIELKAPRVNVDRDEISQIEGYAISVMADERFRGVSTRWQFWVIGDDYGGHARYRMKAFPDGDGIIHRAENVSIAVKTWAQILHENRSRMQFFQERLEYEADKGSSLKHLQEHYADFLRGVVTEGLPEEGEESLEAVAWNGAH